MHLVWCTAAAYHRSGYKNSNHSATGASNYLLDCPEPCFSSFKSLTDMHLRYLSQIDSDPLTEILYIAAR